MQEGPDQCSHLDALIGGMIVLLNMMPGFAYFCVHLNSGGCVHALKSQEPHQAGLQGLLPALAICFSEGC